MNQLELLHSSRALKIGFKSAFGLVSACLLLSPVSSRAVTYSWNGNGVTKSAATASSWQGNALPSDYSDVLFAATSGTVTFVNGQVFKVNDFKVDSNGYVFSTLTNSVNYTIELNSFSGSGLSSATIGTAVNSTSTFSVTLHTNGNTAFSGTIAYTGTAVGGKTGLVKSGTGTLDLTQAKLLHTGETRISGGTLVLSATNQPLDRIRIGMASGGGGSGIVEIAGSGGVDSYFTRSFSNSDGNTIAFGDTSNGAVDIAGFSAVGQNLVLAFGGTNTLQQLNWNTSGGSGVSFKAVAFQLGAATSTHTVFLKNNVNVQADDRILRVGNGTAAIDADVEGAFTLGTAARVLTKDGSGTLRLSGNSSAAAGRLLVAEGKLLVDGTWASATNNTTYGISVASGATLGGDGTVTLSNSSAKLVVDGVLQAGRGGANQSLTLNTNLEMKAGSVLEFTIGGAADSDILQRTGGSWLFQADQLVKITSLGFTGDEYTLITGLAASFGTTYDLTQWRLAPGSNVEGSFRLSGTTLVFDAVPEPSSLLLLGLASGATLAIWRRKRSVF